MPKRSRKDGCLLDDPDVRVWHDNLKRKATSTADVMLKNFEKFCDIMKTSPPEILKVKSPKKLILSYIEKREAKVAGSTIETELKPVRSWLSWNEMTIPGHINIKNANRTPSLANEAVPDQEGLKAILAAADLKSKVAIALIAFSGVRPGVLGDYRGTDGLKVKDIPDLKINDGRVGFENAPAMIRVRQELSKTGNNYFTFLGPEGCAYVQAYLQKRIEKGEKIGPASPVVANSKGKEKHHLYTINIGDMIRKPMRLAGNQNRPYVLRSYFATRLMQAETKGFLRDWRSFMMGHKGDIEHVYTMNKRALPDDLITQMREGYSKALQFLETSFQREESPQKDYVLQSLIGLVEPDVEKAANIQEADIISFLRDKLHLNGNGNHNGNGKQKIIDIEELEKYIEEGYEFVSIIPPSNKKAIVRLAQ